MMMMMFRIISYLRIGFAVWKIADVDLDEVKEIHMGEILNMINTRNLLQPGQTWNTIALLYLLLNDYYLNVCSYALELDLLVYTQLELN